MESKNRIIALRLCELCAFALESLHRPFVPEPLRTSGIKIRQIYKYIYIYMLHIVPHTEHSLCVCFKPDNGNLFCNLRTFPFASCCDNEYLISLEEGGGGGGRRKQPLSCAGGSGSVQVW
jgi:hypothetical protein